jgi:hypothetical protein
MRDKGVIMLFTSITQTLSSDRDESLCATGKRGRRAQFRVHKVAAGVRAFESIAFPQQFIRLVDGVCDIAVRTNFCRWTEVLSVNPDYLFCLKV